MRFKLRLQPGDRNLLLAGLLVLVGLTVLARPSALLTFGFIALAGGLTAGMKKPPDS